MNALTPLLFPLLAALPQGPDEALATYQLDGKTLPVTRTDVALEMAFHLRRRDRGQQAVEQLVAVAITRKAAEDRKLMPSEADVRAFWNDLQAQLRAAGRRPEDIPAVRNTGEAQWLADLAVQLAQKRVVRQELGLKSDEEVSGDMLNLWLQEQRKQTLVVTDPDLLPAGSAARVGSADIPLIDLGALLLRTAEDEERDRFVKQVVYLAALESTARKDGVQVTAADLDAAVKKHKDDAAKDPRYSGVTYENLLKAEGLSAQSIRDLRVFRGQILLDKLARARCRDEDLAAEIAKDRQSALDRHGPRRRLGLIYLRAIDTPNPLVPRDFAAAEREMATVRERLQKEAFDVVARIASEHNASKQQGGDAGWHRRRSERLPEAILAAAFAQPAGAVSAPVRLPDGVALVKTLDVEPDPDDATLRQRLREGKAKEFQQQIFDACKLTMAKAQPAEGRK
ncbi:MAG: peptidylprolyl isomerase [Phycisphaerales bacterium]|nr:peptidylprolyl isomerase [Phycisphaerales bacterium]